MASPSSQLNATVCPPVTVKHTKLFINGEFVDSVSGKKFETLDPRTGKVIASVSEARQEDVDLAVKAARSDWLFERLVYMVAGVIGFL